MSTTARITSRPGQHRSHVEISYDGTRPPRALFADLAMIGWDAPALAAPPREAIDWTVPNPETGERFTVRSYQVDAVVEPPAGSGPRGGWSDGERGVFLSTVERVLDRHGVLEDTTVVHLPPPPDVATGPATLQAAAPAPTADAPPAGAAAERQVALVLDPALHDRVEMLLLGAGLDPSIEIEERTRTETFRGSPHTVSSTVLAVRFSSPDDVAERLVAAIGLLSARRATDQGPALERRGLPLGSGQVRVVVVVAPGRRSAVLEALEELGIAVASESATTITATQNFRGSSTTVQRPASRIDVHVAAGRSDAILAAMAEAGGVSSTDTDRLWVDAPDADEVPEVAPSPTIAAVPAGPSQAAPDLEDHTSMSRSRKKLSTWSRASRVG